MRHQIAVHPRVCGELGRAVGTRNGGRGSSPRVRGTPGICSGMTGGARFIPACAGNSARSALTSTPARGSSPRVRGTRSCLPLRLATTPVHPRVCGELVSNTASAAPFDGSSPRVRGTQQGVSLALGRNRFIPACAGNSSPLNPIAWTRYGSSPRVRGTLWARPAGQRHRRFIPACAGNSATAATRSTSGPVHPRVCGELTLKTAKSAFVAGSSPRVRGTLAKDLAVQLRRRFIPACAGNSSSVWGRCCVRPVHPRVCGELQSASHTSSGTVGSSPRVRGTRD